MTVALCDSFTPGAVASTLAASGRKPTMWKIVACLVLLLPPALCAAAPPTDESLLSLFKAMKAESLVESIYASLEPAMRQALSQATAGKPLTEEQEVVVKQAPRRISEVIRTELSWQRIQPMQMAVYRETFDQAEVDGLIAFYSSPVGRSLVDKMPMVNQKLMSATQSYMLEVMPKLKAAMDQILLEARIAN